MVLGIETVEEVCNRCNGAGQIKYADPKLFNRPIDCWACDAKGFIEVPATESNGLFSRMQRWFSRWAHNVFRPSNL